MSTPQQIYNQLVEHFIKTEELGHYNPETWSIQLYGIPNTPEEIARIREVINRFTGKFNLVVLNPQDEYTSINILDIEL